MTIGAKVPVPVGLGVKTGEIVSGYMAQVPREVNSNPWDMSQPVSP